MTAGEFLIDRAELLESGGLTTQAFDPVPLVGGDVSAELQAWVEAQMGARDICLVLGGSSEIELANARRPDSGDV